MQRRYHILVADADEASLKKTVKLLKRRDYVVAGASTPEEGRWWIDGWPIDLIVANATFGAGTGLQLILAARLTQPELAGLIVTNDLAAASVDGRRHRLSVVPRDIGTTELLNAIAGALAALTRRQRWPRKDVTVAVPMRIGSDDGKLMDVSYGGLKFELAGHSCVLRSPIVVDFPRADLRLQAEVIWAARRSDGRACLFGAAVKLSPTPSTDWRAFVDRLA